MAGGPLKFARSRVECAGATVEVDRGGDGEPLLVLHGELRSPELPQAYELLSDQYEVIAPVLPGFGSSSTADWMLGVRDMAAWLSWFVRDTGLPHPINVVAFSLGAWVATELAIFHPSLFRRLVLVSPAGLKPDSGEIFDYFMATPKESFERAFADPGKSDAYQNHFGREWTPEEAAVFDDDREMTSRLAWRPYLFSLTLSELLPAVSTPTLVIWGSEDHIIPVSTSNQFTNRIPGSRGIVLQGCGHLPHLEDPKAFVSAVLNFLD